MPSYRDLSKPDTVSRHGPNNSAKLQLLMAVMLVSLLVVFTIFGGAPNWSQETNWLITGGAGIIVIILFKRMRRADWLSAPTVYMIVFWMFHFGTIFPAAVSPGLIEALPSWASDWISYPETIVAAYLSLLFLVSFVLGVLIIPTNNQRCTQREPHPELIKMGWFVIACGLLLFLINIIQYGAGVFSLSYLEFFGEISNAFYAPVLIIVEGLILQIAGGRALRSVIRTALFTYLPVALPLFMAGFRTALVFTAVVLMTIMHLRGLALARWRLLVLVVAALIATSSIRNIREYGLAEVTELNSPIRVFVQNPIAGLIELGGSLQPVSATVDYMRKRDFYYGSTYLYPFVRQLAPLFGKEKDTSLTDARLIAIRITSLYGQIGYSTVAEAFANLGILGVVLFAGLWGFALGMLGRISDTAYGLSVFGVVLLPMMINVRNSFLYVPAWILLGMVPILLARILRRRSLGLSPKAKLHKIP